MSAHWSTRYISSNALNNYRPISNLPFLSTILENNVLRQFLAHIQTHTLFSVHQSAYRARHGTETTLLRVVNDILTALEEDTISVLLLLDLSAAFDTIDRDIIMSRLDSSFGIRNTALSWFRSHLSERRQPVAAVYIIHTSTVKSISIEETTEHC